MLLSMAMMTQVKIFLFLLLLLIAIFHMASTAHIVIAIIRDGVVVSLLLTGNSIA